MVTVVGQVDLGTVAELRRVVGDSVRLAGTHPVVIDLNAVSFFGSSGLATLVEAVTQARNRPEPVRLVVDGNRSVTRPIEATGLDSIFVLYPTVEQALSATSGIPRDSAG